MKKSGMFRKAFEIGMSVAIGAVVANAAYHRGKRDAYRDCTEMLKEEIAEFENTINNKEEAE